MSEGPSNGPGGHQAQGQGGQGQGPSASAAASAASGQGGQGPSEDFRDLGPEAAWSLSSAKQGNGDQAKMLGSEIAGFLVLCGSCRSLQRISSPSGKAKSGHYFL